MTGLLMMLLSIAGFAADEPPVTAKVADVAEPPDPFGFDLGGPLAPVVAASECAELEGNVYQCATAPTPLGGVSSYLLLGVDGKLAKVIAVGDELRADKYGSEVRARYESLKKILTDKYGKPKEYDFLRSGALWKDRDDFAMSLRQKERSLVSFWESGATGIVLEAAATSSSSTHVVLTYEHQPTMALHQKQRKEADASAL